MSLKWCVVGMTIKDYLTKHEGLKLKPYRCTAGRLTIGVGRNLDDKGITEEEAVYLLGNDIEECKQDLATIFSDWENLSYNRKLVLIDMRFQLGQTGFRGFKRLISAIKMGDNKKAIQSIKESLYYKQVTSRAEENIKLLEDGDV